MKASCSSSAPSPFDRRRWRWSMAEVVSKSTRHVKVEFLRTNRMFIQAVTRVEDTTLVPLSPPSNPYPVSAQFIPQTSWLTDWLAPCWHSPFQFFYFYLLSNPFGIVTELFIHSPFTCFICNRDICNKRDVEEIPLVIHIRSRIQWLAFIISGMGCSLNSKGVCECQRDHSNPFISPACASLFAKRITSSTFSSDAQIAIWGHSDIL